MKRAVLDVMSLRRNACVVLPAVLLALPLAFGTGCGGRIDPSGLEATASPESTSVAKRPQKSPPQRSIPEDEPEEAGICPASTTFDPADFEALIGAYRSPIVPSWSCSADEMETFRKNLTSTTTFALLKSGLGDTCAACIFTASTDSLWGPIVMLPDGVQGFANAGACHAVVNGSDACGKAVQYDRFCESLACEECSSSELARCAGKVQKSVCKSTHDAIASSCPSLTTSAQKCGPTILSHARFLCAQGT